MKKILEWLKAMPSARAHSDGQTGKKKEAVKPLSLYHKAFCFSRLKRLDTLGFHKLHNLAGILFFVISNQQQLEFWHFFFGDN